MKAKAIQSTERTNCHVRLQVHKERYTPRSVVHRATRMNALITCRPQTTTWMSGIGTTKLKRGFVMTKKRVRASLTIGQRCRVLCVDNAPQLRSTRYNQLRCRSIWKPRSLLNPVIPEKMNLKLLIPRSSATQERPMLIPKEKSTHEHSDFVTFRNNFLTIESHKEKDPD